MFIKVHRVMCLIVTALLILLQITCQNDVEKEFLCRNEECSEPINKFLVMTNYLPDSKEKIRAKRGENGMILAIPKDESTKLYKVKIEDRIGFLPANCIQHQSKGEANISVNLTIPVNTVLKPDSAVPPIPKPSTDEEKNIEMDVPPITNTSSDDINSTASLPIAEESQNDSASSVSNNTSSQVENITNEKDNLVSMSEPLVKEDSSQNQVASEPSSNNQAKKDTESEHPENESMQNLQPSVEKIQHESVDLNIPVKLENISLEVDESVVNVIKDSENISESSANASLNESENVTREISSKKETVDEAVEKIVDSSSNIVNADSPVNEISKTDLNITEIPNDSNTSTDSFENIPKEGFFVENDTASNTPAETETPKNIEENLESTKTDNITSSPDKIDETPEAQLSNLNDTSQNDSAASEVPSDSGADIAQTSDSPKTDPVPPAVIEVEKKGGVSATSEAPIPPDTREMRTFPEEKQPVVDSKEPETLLDGITVSTDSDNENVTSEEIDSTTNDTVPLFSSEIKDEQTEVNQPQDPISPEAIPNEVPPPPYIESTTQPIDPTIPDSSEESFNSSESIPSEPASVTPESSIADETPSYTYSEPYKYHQPKPYPSLFPKTATEKSPDVAEKIDSVSKQEIDETGPETSSEQVAPASEAVPETSSEQLAPASDSTSVPSGVDQSQGLSGYIHTSRKPANENEPESIGGPEISEEKSVYETIVAFLPDLSGLSSSFFETTTGFFDFGSSSPKEAAESEACSAEQFCGTDRLNNHMGKAENLVSENIVEIPLLGVVPKEQITYVSGILTTVCLATILLWWLMNYFNKNRKVGMLISRINQLENKLFISTKEIAALQNKLEENDCQAEAKQNVADIKRITEVYEHKINQYKKRIVELDDKVLYLEKELENVSNSALEMHKLLENSLATQAQSKVALDEVETLRALTESQENQIEDLKREINAVVTENQCLKVDNEMNKSAIKKLEKECSAQTKKNVELSEKNRNLTLQLDKELENSTVLESNYKTEIYELRSKLEDVEMSLKRSEFQVQELQRVVLDKQVGGPSSKNDVQLRLQISTLEAMNNELSGQLNEQKNARRMLEDHVGDVTKELNNLKKSFENSEKERNQAVTKLQVLTQYFKDKEEQLQKELEAKDKLSMERESKDQSLSQKLALMREEINNLKIQNEALQKEVQEQEASYKVQVANAEQKAREHWFEFRQADRKYKECQQEAAILRNKILVLETNMSSISHKGDDKNNSGLNGEISGVSPILYHPSMSPELLPYPSPSDFIPPPPSPLPSHMPDFFPPEPIYSPDERLPPLGGRRAPSPPPPLSPDDEFGPPPPLMKFPSGRNHNVEPAAGYSRRTPPPSGRHRSQFRPRQPRSSIDSPSSGMSLESLDKSGR